MARDISTLGHHRNGDCDIKLSDTKDIDMSCLRKDTLTRQSHDSSSTADH